MTAAADPVPQVGDRVTGTCKHHGVTEFVYFTSSRDRLRMATRCVRCNRDRALWARYKITGDDYDALLDEQNGCCAICRVPQEDIAKSLCVDHNHDTGEVRGLLCHRCNTGLGHFNDEIKHLMRATQYLLR